MASTYVENIDSAIAVYLRRSGKTQDQLATSMNMTANSLMNKRKGLTDFKLSELVRLSEIVGLSLDDLTGLKPAAA
mgnify:CR=1 FL=1